MMKSKRKGNWWSLSGSNRRPPACKAGALPAELRPRKGVVGRGGLEPPTSRLSGVRSNHLSYRPASRSEALLRMRPSSGRTQGAAPRPARVEDSATGGATCILLFGLKGYEDGLAACGLMTQPCQVASRDVVILRSASLPEASLERR